MSGDDVGSCSHILKSCTVIQHEGLPKAHTASLSASDLSGTVGSAASCGPSAEQLAQQLKPVVNLL